MINTTDKQLFEYYGIVSFERDQFRQEIERLTTVLNDTTRQLNNELAEHRNLKDKYEALINGSTGLDSQS